MLKIIDLFSYFIAKVWRPRIIGVELIQFEARGCMAHYWKEQDRGTISAIAIRNAYDGSINGQRISVYIVTRKDGTKFEAIAGRCQIGSKSMAERTLYSRESLVGKIVEVF